MVIEQVLDLYLTNDQKAAVLDSRKNILCLACAGSGKSRTLAFRIAYLIANGCSPQSIIAFTFTDKAAESIKRRVAEDFRVMIRLIDMVHMNVLIYVQKKLLKIMLLHLHKTLKGYERMKLDSTIGQAMVSGAIDLILKHDERGNIVDTHVIDFKSMDNQMILHLKIG